MRRAVTAIAATSAQPVAIPGISNSSSTNYLPVICDTSLTLPLAMRQARFQWIIKSFWTEVEPFGSPKGQECKLYLSRHFQQQLVYETANIQGRRVAHVRLQQAAHHLQQPLQGVVGVGTPPGQHVHPCNANQCPACTIQIH